MDLPRRWSNASIQKADFDAVPLQALRASTSAVAIEGIASTLLDTAAGQYRRNHNAGMLEFCAFLQVVRSGQAENEQNSQLKL
jgi:hypothetical protein